MLWQFNWPLPTVGAQYRARQYEQAYPMFVWREQEVHVLLMLNDCDGSAIGSFSFYLTFRLLENTSTKVEKHQL